MVTEKNWNKEISRNDKKVFDFICKYCEICNFKINVLFISELLPYIIPDYTKIIGWNNTGNPEFRFVDCCKFWQIKIDVDKKEVKLFLPKYVTSLKRKISLKRR